MDKNMLYYSTNRALPTTCKAYAALMNKAKRLFNANLQPCIDWHTGDLDDADTQAYIQNNPTMAACWLAECERKGRIDAAAIVVDLLNKTRTVSDADKNKICIKVTGLDPRCDHDWMW